MACVPVALRALRIFSSACVFSCVRCVFRCVKFLSLRILLRALRIRCVFFLSLRILLRRLRIRCVKFRSLRILLRALRILLRISLRNGLALRALRCVRRMEIGLKSIKAGNTSILQYFKELSGHGRRPLVPECHVKNKNYQRGAAMRLRKVSREVRPRTPVSRSFQSTTVRGKKENLYTSVRQES